MSLFSTYKLEELTRGGISLILGIIYATSDEIHQAFIPGRSAEITDVGIDSMGVLLGVLLVILSIKIYNGKKLQDYNSRLIISFALHKVINI